MVAYLHSLYFGEVFSPLTPGVLLCICSNSNKPSTNHETQHFIECTNVLPGLLGITFTRILNMSLELLQVIHEL